MQWTKDLVNIMSFQERAFKGESSCFRLHEGCINNDRFESWFITMMHASPKGIEILEHWSAVIMCVFAKVQVQLSKIWRSGMQWVLGWRIVFAKFFWRDEIRVQSVHDIFDPSPSWFGTAFLLSH